MEYYSYVVSRDFGFAPNPFGEHCTLATCKPTIRKNANINDWVFGITPKEKGMGNKLVFAMKVTAKITFNEYWNSPVFKYKKPVLNGSLKQMYGDNIYHFNDKLEEWFQADSHHSKENGEINIKNLKRDTGGKFVLISDTFYYFGSQSIDIPFNLKNKFTIGIGHKKVKQEDAVKLIEWLEKSHEKGFHADPKLFTSFQRYDGVS